MASEAVVFSLNNVSIKLKHSKKNEPQLIPAVYYLECQQIQYCEN